jgi:GR25 family glycosyltransferase involved in LPS biosynthesis
MLVHVINLDRSPTRLAEFHQWNGHLRSIQRIVAVDGKTSDVSRLIDIGLIHKDILNSYSEGGIGAAMSHIALWEIAMENSEAITVCEDDAIFNRFFDLEAPRLLHSLPSGWDLIIWGWNLDSSVCFEFLPGVSSTLARFEQNKLRDNCRSFQSLRLSPHTYRLRSFFGTICYTISPKGAQRFKAACLPLQPFVPCISVFERDPALKEYAESAGIDAAMNSAVSQLECYVSFPPLVVTKNELENSTIQINT